MLNHSRFTGILPVKREYLVFVEQASCLLLTLVKNVNLESLCE
ncbi:hypothetical protein [Microcoleus sp. F4-D5]